jgi:hypothetical protein
LLVSDYFGYDNWRSRNAYLSSEGFKGAMVTERSEVSSEYWSIMNSAGIGLETLEIELHGGYADGHVESYGPTEVGGMWVSLRRDGSVANPVAGVFYVPRADGR